METTKLKLELVDTQMRLLQSQMQILYFQRRDLEIQLAQEKEQVHSDMPTEADLSLNK